MRNSTISLLLLVILPFSTVTAADWPQWLGPDRDSVWQEEGIVESFPTEGLAVKWRAPVGLGYSGPAVSRGKVYVCEWTGSGVFFGESCFALTSRLAEKDSRPPHFTKTRSWQIAANSSEKSGGGSVGGQKCSLRTARTTSYAR